MNVHPASEGIAGPRDEQPAAFRTEASEDLVSGRCDVASINRKKWEPDRPSGVANQDPAFDKFPSQARGDLLRAGYLAYQQINTLAHPGSLPGRHVRLQVPCAFAEFPSVSDWVTCKCVAARRRAVLQWPRRGKKCPLYQEGGARDVR